MGGAKSAGGKSRGSKASKASKQSGKSRGSQASKARGRPAASRAHDVPRKRGRSPTPPPKLNKDNVRRASKGASALDRPCVKKHACPSCGRAVRVGDMCYRFSRKHQECGWKDRNLEYTVSKHPEVAPLRFMFFFFYIYLFIFILIIKTNKQ